MDLAALADPEDEDDARRARMRATADRDASALVAVADGVGPIPAALPTAPAPSEPTPPVFAEAIYDYEPGPVTVRLRYPFRIGERHFGQVDVEEPRFDHMQAHLEGKISRIELFATMTGLSVEALGALRWTDAKHVLGICNDLAPE